MVRSSNPPRSGQGVLTIARQSHSVTFEIRFADSQGRRAAKGGITGTPEVMRDAFRQGRAHLALDDGRSLDVAIVAHAEGSATAYFESATELR
jgi:hypothetical protein